MTHEENQDRYLRAMHAVQSGVKQKAEYARSETTPASLRVGVNASMVETAALQKLLIDKGIITWDEWYEYLANQAEHEKALYEAELSEHYGGKITLG